MRKTRYSLGKKSLHVCIIIIVFCMVGTSLAQAETSKQTDETTKQTYSSSYKATTGMNNPVEYYAVIVTGGATHAQLQDLAIRETEEAYYVLRTTWGFADDHIYYLNPDPDYNPADYPVDGVASPTTIHYAISTWLASHLDCNNVGFIYMIDHGQEGGHFNIDVDGDGYLNITSEYIKNSAMGGWLNEIPSYGKLITVLECCYSGWFLNFFSGPNRIGITSSDATHESGIFQNGWSCFSHQFFQSLLWGHSIEQAFSTTTWLPQHSLIDDQCNGETYLGVPHPPPPPYGPIYEEMK
jgi:hypothetical protein